ncbi:ABC transporter substrate-binding protein [Vibrio sp.]|uniref:ABC transporter substrate-binding protein n=1 Tax=Vibrio sp. TaxID=678 RepID=UPI003D0B7760
MAKGKFLSVFLATSVAVAASASVNAETIRIGTEGAYPPFNYYTADGQLAGFDIEIGKALCSEMKVECEFVAQDWDGIIPALLAGKYDLILASMFITDARKQQVAFSEPYQASAMTFVVDKQSGIKDVSPEAMKGMIIGAQGSTTQAEYLLANYPDSEVRLYPTQDAVNLDLVSGRIDAQAGDIMPMTDWLSSTDGACCEKAGDLITDRTYVGDGVGIALRKEDQQLRQRVDQALANIIKDGTYQKINDQFFSINLLTLK